MSYDTRPKPKPLRAFPCPTGVRKSTVRETNPLIVSKAWIETSTAPKIEATGGQFYGYLWFLGRSLPNGREVHWDGALGRGGQSIRIVPELDLVVVVTWGYFQDYSPPAFHVPPGLFST